jgi:PAS domain S-box-containing protein
LVDDVVKLKGVCGSWFNKQRQLFGVRLMVSHTNDIVVLEAPAPDGLQQPAQPIGNLLRFAPRPTESGRRVKVRGIVTLQQPGRAIFVQDEKHGLYVQTRQSGELRPGDEVELLGFPASGDYTPRLQDATWRKIASGPEPTPRLVRPDEALGGFQDARLVSIEGRLLDCAINYSELVLLMAADDRIFSARLESSALPSWQTSLQKGSRLRVSGVCQIEVGEQWQAGPNWRAKAFRILLRNPADVAVVEYPPWWTLQRALWAVGLLIAAVVVSLVWVRQLHRKVGQQTQFIRQQRDVESALKERYQDLFENANDMVYTHELNGKLTSINLAGERLLGLSRSQIVGRSVLDFISEAQRQSATQWLEQILDGVSPPTVEWDFVPAHGDRLRLEISTRLIAREGRQVEVEGIARDVTERRRLENEILEISTREQRRIGHDLHDGVCQQLAGIAFLSETLADRLEEEKRPEATEAQKITELVNVANKQTRGVARGLFPVRLEEYGLVSALEELALNAGAFFNTKCEFQADTAVAVSDHVVAQHLYYIAQESILNAVKHGKARLIQIRLGTAGPDQGVLTVSDNGQGFLSAGSENRGMGIRIMKYRARLIRAAVQVERRGEGGVEVVCRFPIEVNSSNAAPPTAHPMATV